MVESSTLSRSVGSSIMSRFDGSSNLTLTETLFLHQSSSSLKAASVEPKATKVPLLPFSLQEFTATGSYPMRSDPFAAITFVRITSGCQPRRSAVWRELNSAALRDLMESMNRACPLQPTKIATMPIRTIVAGNTTSASVDP